MQAEDKARAWRLAHGIDASRTRDLMRAAFNEPDARSRPTESELMERFGASRSTVRRALTLLSEAGVVERTRGIGTMLRHPLPSADLEDFHGAAESTERSTWLSELTTEVLVWAVVEVTPELARHLTAEVGSDCLCVDTISWWRGIPYSAGTYYTRYPEFTRLRRAELRRDWYTLVREAGIQVADTVVVFQASVADSFDAELLQIEVGGALMVIDSHSTAPSGEVFDLAFTRRSGRNVRIETRMTGHSGRRQPENDRP